MTPEQLKTYLGVFREAKVGQARLITPEFTLEFGFQPELPPELQSFGATPEPGGWKTPHHLDNMVGIEESQ